MKCLDSLFSMRGPNLALLIILALCFALGLETRPDALLSTRSMVMVFEFLLLLSVVCEQTGSPLALSDFRISQDCTLERRGVYLSFLTVSSQ